MRSSEHQRATNLVSKLPWGIHYCLLYHTRIDLLDALVPYFKSGLLNNDYCIWVTSRRADVKDALARMMRELPRFHTYLDNGQIDILPASEWYSKDGVFAGKKVVNGWIDKCNQAVARGYRGMRLSGDTLWLNKKHIWKSFSDYEAELDKTTRKYRMTAICTYSLAKCGAIEVIDVVKNHGFTLLKHGEWHRIENTQRRLASEEAREKAMAHMERRVERRTMELQQANQKLMAEIQKRSRAGASLRESRKQLRALSAYLQSVREAERTHIARELHDEIGQSVTAIKLALERSIRDPSACDLDTLAKALGLANELIGRARDLSLELRPAMLDDLGLLAALRWHFDHYTTQFKIAVDFKQYGLEGRRFAPEIETAAYRIMQEALTNVARHAEVDRVQVQIEADESALRIRVKDLGVGFDMHSLSASKIGGVSSMREVARKLGGQLILESAPTRGAILRAELSLSRGLLRSVSTNRHSRR